MRVIVPHEGIGKQLDEMFAWLDWGVGRDAYSDKRGKQVGQIGSDTMSFYFVMVEDATRFSGQSEFELADLRS